MEINNSRKYNSIFRKKLVNKFEKIKSKSELLDIYNIIIEDIGTDFSTNQNGIFVNMNILSDNCIKKLINYIEDKINITTSQTDTEKVNYNTYKSDIQTSETLQTIIKKAHALIISFTNMV